MSNYMRALSPDPGTGMADSTQHMANQWQDGMTKDDEARIDHVLFYCVDGLIPNEARTVA
jgi:hypothetical protein